MFNDKVTFLFFIFLIRIMPTNVFELIFFLFLLL